MIRTMNTSVYDYELDRFKDADDLERFYQDFGMDGLELQLSTTDRTVPEKIPLHGIIGVHTNMFPYWYDLYSGDTETLMKEFVHWNNADTYYGGTEAGYPLTDAETAQERGRAIIYKRIKAELDQAEALGAQYVVLHACENRLTELWTGVLKNRDAAAIDAVIELVNALTDGSDYHFDLLLENLWTAGFTFTDPDMTRRLMEGLHYPRKGIMLDTGHLLHTNFELKTENEGVDYIHEMLDAHGGLCGYIKGIHLQQSLTGEFMKATRGPAPAVQGDFWDWHNDAMYYVFDQDTHHPWTTPQIRSVVNRIHPQYCCNELMAWDRAALYTAQRIQAKALGSIK